jgi:hypothetical protein
MPRNKRVGVSAKTGNSISSTCAPDCTSARVLVSLPTRKSLPCCARPLYETSASLARWHSLSIDRKSCCSRRSTPYQSQSRTSCSASTNDLARSDVMLLKKICQKSVLWAVPSAAPALVVAPVGAAGA